MHPNPDELHKLTFRDLETEALKIAEELPDKIIDELRTALKYRLELKDIHMCRGDHQVGHDYPIEVLETLIERAKSHPSSRSPSLSSARSRRSDSRTSSINSRTSSESLKNDN